MNILIEKLRYANLTIEETSKIIGIVILFNSQYAKRNKNHKIENIDIIDELTKYYNQDGSFKYNNDIPHFKKLINLLLHESTNKILAPQEMTDIVNYFSISDIINLLIKNNETLQKSTTDNTTNNVPEKIENNVISLETKEALQELRKYYKNGSIIKTPENIDEFYKILENSNLDKIEIKYIKELVNKEISNNNESALSFLTDTEKSIYETSLNLLKSLDYSNNDIYELKKLIQDLQTIIDLLKSTTIKEDRDFLLRDVPNIIEKLSIICNKYKEPETKESTNRFIFLLDKDDIPFIEKDINSLDQVYKKIVYSIIPKININNQHLFRKVLSSEKLPYNMYTIFSPKAYVAFIEIQPGTYLLMGTNIARTGHKELINRLISNQEAIKTIEDSIKDLESKNYILKTHEEYLPLLSESNTSNLTRKRAKNTHN